ncbi:hypothetical protein PQR02_30740 [Paraburkholderia sediminicola]|uniref:Uncharacterized protein n=1 Tax=Paraburkholderia rhynchosiae TaxID=487049 RepID=A0ACC7NJJ2_9BURK
MESNTAYPNKDELAGRGARQPDYALKNSALVRLAKAQIGPRANLLQEIVATAQSICGAESAGTVDSRCLDINVFRLLRHFKLRSPSQTCKSLRNSQSKVMDGPSFRITCAPMHLFPADLWKFHLDMPPLPTTSS